MKRVVIHSDGSCSPNPGPGGWGVVIEGDSDGYRRELRGTEPFTTNNRMELTGAIEALRSLSEPCNVTLVTDSRYLQIGAQDWMYRWHRWNWTKQRKGGRDERVDVPNADLWREIWRLCAIHNVIWKWTPGHGSCAENNRADALASMER